MRDRTNKTVADAELFRQRARTERDQEQPRWGYALWLATRGALIAADCGDEELESRCWAEARAAERRERLQGELALAA